MFWLNQEGMHKPRFNYDIIPTTLLYVCIPKSSSCSSIIVGRLFSSEIWVGESSMFTCGTATVLQVTLLCKNDSVC